MNVLEARLVEAGRTKTHVRYVEASEEPFQARNILSGQIGIVSGVLVVNEVLIGPVLEIKLTRSVEFF